MMFMMIDSDRCPACCLVGKRIQSMTGIFVCPSCNTVFGEFGIVMESQNIREQPVA